MSIFRLFLVISPFLLFGCATGLAPVDIPEASIKAVEQNNASASRLPNSDKSLSPDVMFMLLVAEIAGQRGQYDIAMEGYMEAAKRTHDPKLVERAAMIAMYVKDGKKTNEAVTLWLKQDPNNLTARKISALSALKAGDKQQAIEQFSALLKNDPAGFEKTLLELIGATQNEENNVFLYGVMDSLAVRFPNQASIYFIQALLAADMKKQDIADGKIAQALHIQPDWDKALILQAQMAMYKRDYGRAEMLLKSAVQKYPDNEKLKKMLAQLLIKTAKFESAGEVFENLITHDPNDKESRFSLGLVNMQLDRDSKAETLFKQLVEDKDWRNQASFYLGKLAEKHNNTESAIQWFNEVTDGPFEFEAALTGVSLLAKEKQYARVEQQLKAMEARFPKQKTRVILLQAELYSQEKQYDKAFNKLSEAIVDEPDQEELLYSRALIADKLGKLDIMEEDLTHILTRSPDNVEALNALGYGLADKTTRYQEAETYLLRALKLKPDEAVILDSYGWLKFKMGNPQLALDYLQRAYSKQPETEIAAHLAEVLWFLGKQNESKKLYEKALEKSPFDIYLLQFRDKFIRQNNGS